eukprot:1834121-Rhodomonas_salina.1
MKSFARSTHPIRGRLAENLRPAEASLCCFRSVIRVYSLCPLCTGPDAGHMAVHCISGTTRRKAAHD